MHKHHLVHHQCLQNNIDTWNTLQLVHCLNKNSHGTSSLNYQSSFKILHLSLTTYLMLGLILLLLLLMQLPVWLAGRVVMGLDNRFESRPPRCRVQPWASCLHTCASVTKQYNLVPANGRWCLSTGEVTFLGLVESKWQHTSGFMASVTCGLTAEDRDQLRNPTLVSSMGLSYLSLLVLLLLL